MYLYITSHVHHMAKLISRATSYVYIYYKQRKFEGENCFGFHEFSKKTLLILICNAM